MSLPQTPKKAGQRRLLALDGGGIRGMITIEVLARVETILRDQSRNPKLVLADYFDYIAGTSTGAIIAACLSLGMDVATLRQFYLESGRQMFEKAGLLDRLKYKYEDEPLAQKLRDTIGQYTGDPYATLGHDALRTYLMMVLRNATTDSPWPVSNNPDAKYNDARRPDSNLKIPLWQLVRASTAAPVYFPPEVVTVGQQSFIFVDGGITMYNNPAFQMFLMATAEPYRLNWKATEDGMLLVSVGTGTAAAANANLSPGDMNLLYNATSIPGALMSAALHEQDLLCRIFGRCLAGDPIDREVGSFVDKDPCGKAGPVNPKLFTYVRYNATLTNDGLTNLGLSGISPEDVQQLDSIEHIGALQKVGEAVGRKRVDPKHFEKFAP